MGYIGEPRELLHIVCNLSAFLGAFEELYKVYSNSTNEWYSWNIAN